MPERRGLPAGRFPTPSNKSPSQGGPGFSSFLLRNANATSDKNARRGPVADQAACLNTLPTPSLIGSAVSVAIFCASAANSLVCAVTASKCLRTCAVESSTTSDSDFAVQSSVAKSNAALVLTRAASISLRLYSVVPLLALA